MAAPAPEDPNGCSPIFVPSGSLRCRGGASGRLREALHGGRDHLEAGGTPAVEFSVDDQSVTFSTLDKSPRAGLVSFVARTPLKSP